MFSTGLESLIARKSIFKIKGKGKSGVSGTEILKKIFNRETILYLVVGIATMIENVLLFEVLLHCGWKYKVANFVTLVVVKLTAYILNKNLVFRSKTGSWIGLGQEFIRFLIARGATMLVDYFGLILLADGLHFNLFYSKCFITVFVIVLNYFIGKKHVFKN